MGRERSVSVARVVSGPLVALSLSAFALGIGCPNANAAELQVGPRLAVDPADVPVQAEGWPEGMASDGLDWMVLINQDNIDYPKPLAVARVSEDGAVLGYPTTIPVGGQASDGWLSFDGVDYVAVWAENGAQGWRTRLQRIAPDGTLLGETLNLLPNLTGYSRTALASSSGSDLVVRCDSSANGSTCTWVNVVGSNVVASDSIVLQGHVQSLSVAPSGGSWLLAAQVSDDVFMLRIGANGQALDEQAVPLANSDATEEAPFVAPAESGWAVVWRADQELRSALVGADGSLEISPNPLMNQGTAFQEPSIHAAADGFVVVDERSGDGIVTRFLGPDLTPTSDLVVVEEGNQYHGRVKSSWGVSSLLVAWNGDGTFAKRISATAEVLDSIPISVTTKPNDQEYPAGARGAGSWLVAWKDDRRASLKSPQVRDIYAQLLDDEGDPQGTSPLLVAASAADYSPAVAGGPCGWLIAWNYLGQVQAARVSPSGELLDTTPIHIGSGGSPRVIFDGTRWVVGWIDGTARIARLDVSGMVVDKSPIIVSQSGTTVSGRISLGVDSVGYAVGWIQPEGVVVRHVNFQGKPVETAATALIPPATVDAHELVYRAGKGWLLWTANSPFGVNFQTLGAGLPTQTLQDGGYDLVGMGSLALTAWHTNDHLNLGLAPEDGQLALKAELPKLNQAEFSDLNGVALGAALAVRNESQALLMSSSSSGTRVPYARVYAQVVEVTGGDEPGADVDQGECNFDPGSGGAGGESAAGTSGENAGGESSGGAGDAGGESSGGDSGNAGGTAGDASGGRPSGTGANGGAPTSNEGGSPTGQAGLDDDGSANPWRDRYTECTCRVGQRPNSKAPLLALLTALGFCVRRRNRSASSL